ncbi:hypothetical protein [Roseomonas sp. 18066]|uniref:hypothetical protein n=1 Tax=Roseomonas sp. 18066 TaxID=2681412 RepID=UPI0013589DA3|nr:hypothetical protein [Roseomonas sp. 18066]
MTANRIFFLVFNALLALVGLLLAGASVDGPLTFFALSLFLFGTLFALWLVKKTYDERDHQA